MRMQIVLMVIAVSVLAGCNKPAEETKNPNTAQPAAAGSADESSVHMSVSHAGNWGKILILLRHTLH